MDDEYTKQIDRVFARSIDFIFSFPLKTKNHLAYRNESTN